MKERLVGAAVLIALGVWLIPWILDGRDEGVVDETTEAVELPTAEAPARTQTRTIALNEPPQRAADAGAEPAAPAAAPAQSAATAAGGERTGPRPQAGPTTPDVGSRGADTGPAQTQTAATGAAATDAAATGVARSAPAPDGPAADTPAGAAEPAAAANQAAGGWYVQLGSFSEEDNARRLAGRVATFGYDADVSTYRAGGRTLNRVRVGPSATRDGAEVVASSLAAHGFVAQVVSAD